MEDNPNRPEGAVPPDTRRGVPPSFRSSTDELVYLACPVCNRRLRQPFAASGGPQVYVHRHKNRADCRLIVTPREQRVVAVPDHVSLEDALRTALVAA